MRTRVFVVAVVCSQSAASRFDLQRLLSPLLSPLHFFFPFPFPSRGDLFLPKNALPTVISVINGRPLTTRFILDQRFVVEAGGQIDSGGTNAGSCPRSKATLPVPRHCLSPHARKTTRSSRC
jgi:hypothetical protein